MNADGADIEAWEAMFITSIDTDRQEVSGNDSDPEFSHRLPPVPARGCEDIIYPEAGLQVGEGGLSADGRGWGGGLEHESDQTEEH